MGFPGLPDNYMVHWWCRVESRLNAFGTYPHGQKITCHTIHCIGVFCTRRWQFGRKTCATQIFTTTVYEKKRKNTASIRAGCFFFQSPTGADSAMRKSASPWQILYGCCGLRTTILFPNSEERTMSPHSSCLKTSESSVSMPKSIIRF